MRFLPRNRFPLLFVALLIFCSAMVVRQLTANQSKHTDLREAFILLYSKGERPDADKLYKRLMRDLENLPTRNLLEDYDRTLLLVDPLSPSFDNLIWRYHQSVSKEIEKRSPSILQHAKKLANEEK